MIIVQLIALIYKDQHAENLQKVIATFLASSTSDSSEDDESNTSPQVSGNVQSIWSNPLIFFLL